MEALTATPRALFPRASPAALMATARRAPSARRRCAAPVRASAAAAEPAGEAKPAAAPKAAGDDGAAAAAPKKVLKKKPVYSMKKGQIVRVDKEKYLNSINVRELVQLSICRRMSLSLSHIYTIHIYKSVTDAHDRCTYVFEFSTCQLGIRPSTKAWITSTKTAARYWTSESLKPENTPWSVTQFVSS
ncbi:uncharacterized protein LOC120675788 isoform X1 [Panicum virgatum]|uniref:uncharacterized protein LOC120675788 isoform X1 n=1 Tax=Panicum virgatum TaxID=38727 RepID=UPI0019D57DD2|nr:uncharacterized protein LOC120675788 isoform X1 [Panicum virgatum]